MLHGPRVSAWSWWGTGRNEVWAYLDMDGFFAAVESAHRGLRCSVPLAVVAADPDAVHPRAVLIAVNLAARAAGLRSGTLLRDARRRVPRVVVAAQCPPRYVAAHRQVLAAVERVVPIAAVPSVDEVVARLGPSDCARSVADAVRAELRTTFGPLVTGSVGVAPSVPLAKMAAAAAKPDGARVVRPEQVRAFLAGRVLDAVPGVGPALGLRLVRAGLCDALALHDADPAQVRAVWGSVVGARLQLALRGVDAGLATRPSVPERIGHARVLTPAQRSPRVVRALVRGLAVVGAQRLRRERWAALRIEVRAASGARDVTVRSPVGCFRGEREALRTVSALWDALAPGPDLRVVEVGYAGLGAWPPAQHALLARANDPVDEAVDALRARFGAHVIGRAGVRRTRWMGEKIAFHRVPGT